MGNPTDQETTPLLSQKSSPPPTRKFPLNVVPEAVVPYLELIRLEKPTGAILFFWPFAWGLTMAAYESRLPLSKYLTGLAASAFAAFITRGSACTVNDIFDRELDAGVERCKNRPLASGRISVWAACIYLVVLYAIGVVFYLFTVEGLALWVGLAQLLPIFIIYPLMKRITYWPQAWLGFAMNFGFIVQWAATTDSQPWLLFAVCMTGFWCWTMVYDTVYACQDIKDDVKVGVKSTAIVFGSWIRPILVSLGLGFVSMLCVAGVLNNQGPAYFLISVGGTLAHFVWQYHTVDLEVPRTCWANFNHNGRQLGVIVWAGMMIDYLTSIGVISY